MKAPQKPLIIGSRGSALALWQAEWTKRELQKRFPHLDIHIAVITTTGDSILDSPLSTIGDKGLFTKEIEQALLDGRVDAAVHSLKDLPTHLPDGLTIGAITKREDVRDVFISHPRKTHTSLASLPGNAIVATGSLRRRAQLLSIRPDVTVVDLRGNLNTRFSKLDASDWDGIILARAGVVRLGMENRITEVIPAETILPAVGQGALAIEIRAEDRDTLRYVRTLASESTTIATLGERALLRFLEGGCQVPIGAYGRVVDNVFHLDALIGSLDGKTIVRGKIHGNPSESEALGIHLAETLHAGGGREILEAIRLRSSGEKPSA